MLRTTILYILAGLISLSAGARSIKLTHGEFVHLSVSQKNEWIVKTMELMVELEGRYKREVKTSGFSLERLEKYTQILKRFDEILMASAYADSSSVNLQTHSQNFSDLLRNTNNGKNCIYAGWISEVVTQLGQEYCTHPNYLANESAKKLAYAKGTSCGGRNKITCNPAIFGFQSHANQSVFCVEAGLEQAHNSSYSCMKAALSETASSGTDSADSRLAHLRQHLSDNPQLFEDVQKFVFQTCVCETTPINLDTNYHNYMRPHRTCYGLMEMLAATACEEKNIHFDTTIFEKLREFTHGKILTSSSGPEIDSTYKSYLSHLKQNSPNEYAGLCAHDTGIRTYQCKSVTCTAIKSAQAETNPDETSGSAEKFNCAFDIVSVMDNKEESAPPTTTPTELPLSKTDTSLSIKATFGTRTESLSCPLTIVGAVEEELASEEPPKEVDVPTIKLILGAKTATTQNITAEKSENSDGYTVVWYRKGFVSSTETKQETPSGLAEDSPDEKSTTPSDSPQPDETKDTIPNSDGKTELEEPRKSSIYQTCAKLVAPDKPDSSESCVSVPKLEIAEMPKTPVVGPSGQNNQPRQSPPPRGVTNSSALGIR